MTTEAQRIGRIATVVVDGRAITGAIYHMRPNGWPCVEARDGRVASGPETARQLDRVA